ncbi:DRC3 protein, partial [Rhinopomastus cyanomelas]|nr:DRC3 protein [Rhinopomastus cyanomelas]
MSQLYNNSEPNVIDDEMVQKAIEEQYPADIAQIAKKEGIDFKDVTELQLSFQNILQIDNLWQFVNLTKLQLDNNIIEKIEALESLVHLVWLDLSFNNIKVIEGLDTLVKLEDLSLFNNRISKLERMDTLRELQVFSIGKNNLTSLEEVTYLRRFKKLRSLNLLGNPICNDERYTSFVVAYLPDLVYLDFKLVSDTTVSLMPSQSVAAGDSVFCKIKRCFLSLGCGVLAAKPHVGQATFVEHLNGSFLFDDMFAKDAEAAKLAELPEVRDLLQEYPFWDFISICENLFNYGLKELEKREAEVSEFNKRLHEAVTANQQEGRKIILDFEERHRWRLNEVLNASSYEIADSQRAEHRENILQLSEALMTLEMQIADQLEELIKEFKGNVAVMTSTFVENIREIYPLAWTSCWAFSLTVFPTITQCHELESHHHEKLLEISISTLEKSVKNELEEDLPADVR